MFVFTGLFLLQAGLYSQLPPRVDLRFVGFSGNWERELFREDQAATNDFYLRLFLSAGSKGGETIYASARSGLELCIQELDKPSFHKKPERTRIQLVEKKMQDAFLKKFSIGSTFDQLFIDGSYNSYTASAATWLLLNRLGIPCEIHQVQEEVYLVAFPSGKVQEIRFPVPGNLTYQVDENVKNAFIGFLTGQKKIKEEEVEGLRREEIFKEYFYGKSLIQPGNLAGLLYMVAAFSENSQGNSRPALDLMLKSYLLNPAMRQLFYSVSLLGNSFRSADFTTQKDWDLFVIASWFVGSGVEVEEITAEYGRVTQRHLIDNGNLTLYVSMSDYMLAGIGDLNVHSGLAYIYQYEKGRYHYLKANFPEAIKYFQAAYLEKPKSLEAQTAFVTGIYTGLQGMNLVERIRKFEDWNQQFPDLSANGVYMLMYLSTLLEYFTSLYDLAETEQAEKYRYEFEKLAAEHKDVSLGANDIGEAYTAAALYYFGKGQSKKAREILLKGLELSPGNELLRYRLRSI
jgi:tetratricopeptide (TPR) repeat protein